MSDVEFVMGYFTVTKERATDMIARGLDVSMLRDGANDFINKEINADAEVSKLDQMLAKASAELKKGADNI